MQDVLLIGLFLPLASFLFLLLTSSWIGRSSACLIACGAVFFSFLSFLFLFFSYAGNPIDFILFQWIPIEGINAHFHLHLDALALLMTLIITGIGFLIHMYSVGYMDHEKDYARYFALLNFFVFSMLLLVLAGHLLLLFVGWEGVGLASYLLIGFWYERPSAARAATKAFIVNRIGDLGLLLGLLLTFHLFGTGHIGEISSRVGKEFAVGAPLLTALTLLYFFGATGKSAQLPLHVWLADAMEGPTPVSALIHAATMVTAGVYLVVRMHAVFLLAPFTLQVIGVVGALTSLFAAMAAVGQTDLKRVLAYSTVSQLGLMFLACGIGAFYSAMFHLTNHAFIKALLFMSAGNVVHMMHGTTQMEKMGGLWKVFSKTHILFAIGVLALAGIPPLAAFFSKDLILEEEYLAGYKILFYIALFASILTAFYLTRAYCLTFLGNRRLQDATVKEAPAVMLLPVSVLAFFSIGGGLLGFGCGQMPLLERFLVEVGLSEQEREVASGCFTSAETLLAAAGSLLGAALAGALYTRFADRLGAPIEFLKRAFYIDELYQLLIVWPLAALARFATSVVEPHLFEGSLQAVARMAHGTSMWLQKVQSGQIRSYVAWMAIGSGLIVVYLAFLRGTYA